jgi:DNA-binding CsgD family transcriptional regulator/tetratricopeptide (TPR) repeat protein
VAIDTATTLLEREQELAKLADALAAAEAGRGNVVLLEAPAGLGKTSLLKAAAESAPESGFTCLRARAGELERDFAYGCVRQLFEPVVARADGGRRERLFGGAAALSRPLFTPTPDSPLPASDGAFSVLHGLYWLLNNLADEGPVALLVDDLHWSDAESLRLLNYLAPRLDGLAVAVLATTRPGEGDAGALARLAAAPETTVIGPRPLSTQATATLCERKLGAEVAAEFAAACRAVTGGNPFFLEALLREARERGFPTGAAGAERVRGIGPAAVAQAVLIRLEGRPPAAAALVQAAAVLGDGARPAEAARLADLPEPEAAEAADLLVALGILSAAESLEFAHPIVREAVYRDLGPRERARAHARAAQILAEAGASEERVAAQVMESDPAGDPDLVELLRRVAAGALVQGAPTAAAAWLRRALAEPPAPDKRGAVLLELGSAELRLGAPEAAEHLAAAAEQLRGEPTELARAARQHALALTISGRADQSLGALESAIEVVEPVDRELALTLEGELASHARQASVVTRAPAMKRLERHRDLDGTTPGERLVLASLACERARRSESAAEAAQHLEDALAGGRLLAEQDVDVGGPFYDIVIGLLAADALDVAEGALEQALADARSRAAIPAVAFLTSRRGWVHLRRGAVAQAEVDGRTALELLTVHGIPLGIPSSLALLMEALVERGDAEAAEADLRGADIGQEILPGPTNNFFFEARALLELARGRTRQALDDLLEFGRRDEGWGVANPLASRWRSRAALVHVARGEVEEARALAAEDLEQAQRWGTARGVGMALRASALVEGAPVDRLREAADTLAGSTARLEHARALVDLGAAMRRDNRRAEARAVLEEGRDVAERCGARALAETARTELLAAGGRSSDPFGDPLAQLTVSERRVAELAAEGRSNPEIAQALFVTRKTVETHLGHVYRKLDIAGRGELPRAIAGT